MVSVLGARVVGGLEPYAHDGQHNSPASSERSTTTASVSTINIGCTPSTK
jgi:hypothetical protein